MANYNKSFNFRNGVQVDEDDLIVRGSLVGIGTTIPRAELDVYGTIRSTGIITANNLYVSGIATLANVQIGTGITIDGDSGVIAAKFFGDGAGLFNIPTSQWVDVDPAVFAPLPPPPGAGTGYTSIYAAGTVGIGTTIPRYYLQIGGDPTLNQNGVGIGSDGNIILSGILTAGSLIGSGAGITSINAANISSGILDSARFPSTFTLSGVAVTSFTATNVNITGISTIGFATIANAYIGIGTFSKLFGGDIEGNIANFSTLYATSGIITSLNGTGFNYVTGNLSNLYSVSGIITSLSGTNLNYSGIATIGLASATNAFVSGIATIGIATINSGFFGDLLSTNINVSGTHTVGYLTASSSFIGYSTARNLTSGNILVSTPIDSNLISTVDGDLILDSHNGLIVANNNLFVSGISTLSGEVIVSADIIPDTSNVSNLGKLGQEFFELWVGDIKAGVGVGNSNRIETSFEDLILDSATNQVIIDANLSVTGISTFTNLNFESNVEPSIDLGAALGSALKRFSSSQIGALRVGVAQTFEIDTTDGTDLVLNSSSGTTRINDNLFVTGIGSFSGELIVDTGIVPDESVGAYLGTTGKPFSEAYIDSVRIGVAASTEIGTASGNLRLNASSNQTEILTNLAISGVTTVSSAASFSQETQFVGLSTFYNGISPDIDKGAFIGSNEKSFAQAFVNEVRIGVGETNRIDTREGSLSLDGADGIVNINNNFVVNGISTFTSEIIPPSDSTSSIGTVGKSFGQAFIGDVQISSSSNNTIDTRTGDLILDAQTGKVIVNQDFEVSGIAAFNDINLGNNTLVVDTANQRVGIGSTIPDQELSVVGDAKIVGILNVGEIGSSIVLDGNTQTLSVKDLVVTGSTTGVTAIGSGVSVSRLESGNSGIVDLLVFTTDFLLSPINSGITTISLSPNIGIGVGVTIGIGTDIVLPDSKLHIEGNTYISQSLLVQESITALDGFSSGVGTSVKIDGLVDEGFGGAFVLSAVGVGTLFISLPQSPNDSVELGVWNSTESGYSTLENVGIGTTNPTSKLDVRGDVRVGVNTSQGVILTSPNGTKYRLIVDNSGTLSTVLVP
jgi:hypothetical protein